MCAEKSPAAPTPDESGALLEDLRNILVTEESRGIKEVVEILGQIQSRIEDRQGLIELLTPVIASAIAEAAKKEPDALRNALAPIVRAIAAERGEAPPPDVRPRQPLLAGFAERARALLGRGQPAVSRVVEDTAPPLAAAPEVCDAEFALIELFVLAHPSLALLAHGSWQAPHLQAQAEELLLPLLRRFIREKAPGQDPSEPLRAVIDRLHAHIEPGPHAHLIVLYEGTPSVGFFLDVRQSLATLHAQSKDALRRAHAVQAYRGTLRLLLDRYRPEDSRMGPQSRRDPLRWPPPGTFSIETAPPPGGGDAGRR
ncbi:MAG TPA: hypothetical protein DCM87_02185 [Planctomycetes bacterium]|nr:hypothetical protein [Planctomycetota bacterium]